MPPLPAPPRSNRALAWLALALLWGLSTAALVLGSQIATALAH